MLLNRAVDPHSFFADPAVFLNADLDPGGKMNADPWGSGSSFKNFVKNKTHEKFSVVVKYIKDYSKVGNNGALCKFTFKIE